MAFNYGRYPRRLAGKRFGRRFVPMRSRGYRGGGFGSGGLAKRYTAKYRGATFGGGSSAAATRSLRYTNWNAHPEELKYLDQPGGIIQHAIGNTGLVALMNGIPAGSTAITREGRQCIWRSVSLSGTVKAVDATVWSSRNDIFLIWDKQPGAAAPAITDIFTYGKAGSPLNLDYRERFVVLAHRSYVIGGVPISTTAIGCLTPTVHSVNINVKLNHRTTFKGDANTIGDIATGAMYLVLLGDNPDTEGGQFEGYCRLRFSER